MIAVSYQLYGNADCHLEIRAAGVHYLNRASKTFREMNVDRSRVKYFNNDVYARNMG